MRTPVMTGAGMVLLNAALAYSLMQVFGVAGIALATTIVGFLNVGLLVWLLRRSLEQLEVGRLVAGALRIGLATVVAMALWWLAMRANLPGLAPGRFAEALRLFLGGGLAVGAYLAVCLALRVDEIRLLRSMVRRSN
jgi:peptidoglycan biosynthesis protein MviN/MurJ (putative lipid II flippase)